MNDEAKEKGNLQALAIENAETEILLLSKKAVLEIWSLDKYKSEVNRAIDQAKKDAPSISERIEKPLKDYATKAIFQQKRILEYNAQFLAFLIIANERTEATEKKIGEEVLKSDGFTREVNRNLLEPQGNVWETGMPRKEYMKTYMKRVSDLYRNLVEMNAQEAYDSNVSLRNVAEMTVRYESQIDMINRHKENGEKLVWIIPHANCSKRCEPYQGHLYSLDHTEGDIDGIHYRPLEYATDNPRDRYITRKGVVYQNGCLTGFNCRHRIEPYKGQVVKEIPAKEVKKYREINDKQREYERRIRLYKKSYIEYGSTPEGKAFRKKAIETNKQYKAFCEKNDVAYYPDRLKIL